MTPGQPPEGHCNHEPVCVNNTEKYYGCKTPCDTSSGTRYKCPYDTRTHNPSTTEAPEQGNEPMYLISKTELFQITHMSSRNIVGITRDKVLSRPAQPRPPQQENEWVSIDNPNCPIYLDLKKVAIRNQAYADFKRDLKIEVAKWHEEDPLLMAYVKGQEAGATAAAAKERERIIDKINKAQIPYPHYRKTPGDRGTMDKNCWLTREVIDLIKSTPRISHTPTTTEAPEQGSDEAIFDYDAFEEKLHNFIAVNYPELSMTAHEKMCEGVSSLVDDCTRAQSRPTKEEQK
jgi:hypothetical protein